MSDTVAYTHRAYSGESVNDTPATNTDSGDDTSGDTSTEGDNTSTETVKSPIEITNEEGNVVLSIRYTDPSKDTEGSRSLQNASDVFELQHKVNSFAGIRVKEN